MPRRQDRSALRCDRNGWSICYQTRCFSELFFGRTPYLLLHCTKHRHVHEPMLVTPRAPRQVSLAQLLACGLIEESEVHVDGHVNESVRVRAEQQFLSLNPPSPPAAPRRRRPSTAPHRRHNVQIPQPPPLPLSSRTSSAHVHRIHVRRDNTGSDRVPKRTSLDTCCICYTKDRDHAIAPCFHMCVCVTCAQRITACPMCRGEVIQIHRIYF